MKKIKNFDVMILVNFIANTLIYLISPSINILIYSSITQSKIAILAIFGCVVGIVVSLSWAKNPDKLFRYFSHFCIAEVIIDIILCIIAIYTKNIVLFYMLYVIISTTIVKNIGAGYNLLKILRYDSKEKRNTFDNLNNVGINISTIIGSILAIVFKPSFNSIIIIYTVANTIDNIAYAFIVYSLKKNGKI